MYRAHYSEPSGKPPHHARAEMHVALVREPIRVHHIRTMHELRSGATAEKMEAGLQNLGAVAESSSGLGKE